MVFGIKMDMVNTLYLYVIKKKGLIGPAQLKHELQAYLGQANKPDSIWASTFQTRPFKISDQPTLTHLIRLVLPNLFISSLIL